MIQRRLLTEAIAASLSSTTGRPVSALDAPVPTTGQTYNDLMPYAILTPMPGSQFADNMSGVYTDVTLTYQVSAVGMSYEQAEWMLDKVRDAFINPLYPFPVSGYEVIAKLPDTGPQVPEKAGDELWSVAERYKVRVFAP